MTFKNKLAVSNLAFDPRKKLEAYAILAKEGFSGVEVAPTRLYEWSYFNEKKATLENKILSDHGLSVSALQAIFYSTNDCGLLGSKLQFINFLDHLEKVCNIACNLSTNVLVFGSPKIRNRNNMPIIEATKLACERLLESSDLLSKFNITLAVEPIPKYYGSDFLLSAKQVINLLTKINNRFIRLNLDTGCAKLGRYNIQDSIKEGFEYLCNFQVTNEDLKFFLNNPIEHKKTAIELSKIGYNKWISHEVLGGGDEDLKLFHKSILFVRDVYGN